MSEKTEREKIMDALSSPNVGKVTGVPIPDAPTRQEGPPRLEPPNVHQDRLDRYQEAKEVYGSQERAVLEGIPRVPRSVDMLLQYAPTQEDKLAALEHSFGEDNVEYRPHFGIYVVREWDAEKGDWNVYKTDEPGITWRDVEDVGQGALALAPEIAGGIATTSYALSKAPQAPHSKLGLLGLAAAGAAGGEAAGAMKDYAFRKWGIKTDPKTGEIIKRRTINTGLGTGLGYGVGRLMGGGNVGLKITDDASGGFGKADELIAKEGRDAAERLGIEQSAGQSTLKPSTVKLEAHASRAVERVPTTQPPLEKFERSLSSGADAARKKVTGDGLDYGRLEGRITGKLGEMDEALRREAMGEADASLSESVREVNRAGANTIPSRASVGDVAENIQGTLRNRAEQMGAEVSAQYKSVENALSDEGVGQFVKFERLRKAIQDWREVRSPKAKIEAEANPEVTESTVLGPTGERIPVTAKEVIEGEGGKRVAVGEFGESDAKAAQWLSIADEPQTLQEAQTLISRLGELTRAGQPEIGSVGFSKKALFDFYKAAKADLGDSFDDLDIDAKLRTMWDEANLAHYNKVERLNRSELVQDVIRGGREGGIINQRELFSKLLSGKGRTGDLKLIREIVGEDSFAQLRSGLYDDMIGKGTVTLSDGSELVDLSQLNKMVASNLDDDFLVELTGSHEAVDGLRQVLRRWDKIQQAHGTIGKTSGIDMNTFTKIMDDLTAVGGGGKNRAAQRMEDAVRADTARRREFYDDIAKDTIRGRLGILHSNPEQFVDDILLSGDATFVAGGRSLFKKLPPDLQGDIRRHVADRIIARAIDLHKTPISKLVTREGVEISEQKLIKELYGNTYRYNTVRQILDKSQMEVLNDLAAVMLARARYEQIAGQAGRFAVETAIGSGSAKNMLGQVALSRAVFYPPVQDILSKGASNASVVSKLYHVLGKTAAQHDLAISPSRVKMIQALTAPAQHEVGRPVLEQVMDARGRMIEEYGKEGGQFFDDLFGVPPEGSSERKAIMDALGD